MVKYTKEDVDQLIDLIRTYAHAHMPITQQLSETIDEIIKSDLRLCIYYNRKILRYPTVKRYFISMIILSAAADSEGGIVNMPPEFNGRIGKVTTASPTQEERMYL